MAGSSMTKLERARSHAAAVRQKVGLGVAVAAGTASSVGTGAALAVGEHYYNKALPAGSALEKIPMKPVVGVLMHTFGAFTKAGGAANRALHNSGDTCLGVSTYEGIKAHLEAP